MSHYDGESIYSPETAGEDAANRALARRQQEYRREVRQWEEQLVRLHTDLEGRRQEAETQKEIVHRRRAELWTDREQLQSDRNDLEVNRATVQRNREILANRELEVRKREELRRRNRTSSAAYIEDRFSILTPRAVIDDLTHSSPRVRKHVMDNVSTCITGSSFNDAPPTLVRFKPEDIAPYLLPKLHQLISVPDKPVNSVMQFAEEVVSSPPMAKALALCGDCPRLASYLVQQNQYVNQLAITALRQMTRLESTVVKAAYDALAVVVPEIPVSPSLHPAVAFIEELTPKIIADCFNNGLWDAVSPLVAHKIDSIRRAALPKIILEAQHSDRTRHGLVEANTLGLLDQQYQLPSPPPDVLDFFVRLTPLLADKICRRVDNALWLLHRIGDPNPKINMTVLEVLRTCSMKQDPTIYNIFVQAKVLRRLNEPPTPPSFEVNALICELLPILAVPHARKKQLSVIIRYLDHAESTISNAGLIACKKIVDSTFEDRACLYSEFSKLNFAKESSLKLCDYAMPVFCKDWAAGGDFASIARLLTHTERRIRVPAQRVWNDAIINTPPARAKIVRDNLLGVIFELCNSQYEDCIVTGYQTLPHMAVEIIKTGTNYTRQLVKLLNHPRVELRRAALKSIQVVSESSNANCEVLLSVEAFEELTLALQTNPQDSIDATRKILIRLTPFLSTSSDACARLLQLLDSKDPQVEGATRTTLSSIAYTNTEYRETLRNVILDRLVVASDAQIEFTALAIKGWIGLDLAQLNDFETFFDLVSHSNKSIQTAALSSLKQRMSEREYQELLERANIISVLRSLSSSDNPEAISFVAFALPTMAPTLAHNNHVDVILELLAWDEPQIREGASTATENIANGSVNDRKHLLDVDILERLIGNYEPLEQTELQLSSTIIPKLSLDYLRAGKVDFILGLVDHPQQHLRVAATRSVTTMVGGAPADRARLRHALLLRLHGPSAPSGALREVAANSLSRILARDMVKDGDLLQLFRLFENGDPRIRAPAITELWSFIQASDETARRRIVDAEVLPAILHAGFRGKDDLIAFTADCVLPILGPSFSQHDGGTSIVPLLDHNEPRIRTAAAMALRGVVDSRYGNVENMVKAGMISKLHAAMGRDDNVRDLWCHLLPKAAPFLSVRAEIDILFTSLGDGREIVRQSAMEAIGIMAKTSNETRNHLFPALLHCLDEPANYALGIIAQAVSLSGFAFVSNGKEAELLYIVEHGNPVLIAPAVSAIAELLSKGGESEHRKLMEAEIFHVALAFHQNPSRRDLSLKLLYDIISHLCHAIIIKEGLAKELLDLFDDPDPHLSQVLFQSLAANPRVLGSSIFPRLLPMLASADKMRNLFVSKLVRHWAPEMVSRLIKVRQVDIILKVFNAGDPTVTKAYLQEIRNNAIDAREEEKDLLVDELQFVPALGNYLKSRDATLRRISSEIVEILSNGSAFRSGRIMEEGIGSSLAWVAANGDSKEAQYASINALATLLSAAPDHANQLVSDSLPAVCDILEDFHRSLDVHFSSLGFLTDIAQHSPWHRIIIDSGIIPSLVMWLSPQHSITDPKCKQFAFQICEEIAQKSDFGRKALIDGGILPVLLRLATNNIGTNVINACKVLDALAYSGTYRETLIEAGAKKVMEQITSLFRPSTLTNNRDKTKAQDAAKQVLKTFKLTKNSTAGTRDSFTEPNSLRRSVMLPPGRSASLSLPRSAGMNSPTQETAHNHVRWHASESAADSNAADTAYQRDEVVLDGNRPPRPQHPRSVGHVRRLTDPGYGALRTHPSRLTEIEEDRVVDAPSQVHEDRIGPPGGTDARWRTVGVTARPSFTRGPVPRSMNSPLGENSGLHVAGSEQDGEIPGSSYYMARSPLGGEVRSERLAGSSEMSTDISRLPSYHTMPVPTSARSTRRTYRST